MITVTIRQLQAADQHVMRLANREWPAHLSLKIARLLKAVREEMTTFQPKWKALVEKHGEPVEGQEGTFRVPQEKHAEFEAEAEPLKDTVVELNCLPVHINDFGGAPIHPESILALDWFIITEGQ